MPTGDEVVDPVDAIALAWRRERPDLPVESIGVVTRVWQAAKLLGDERTRLLRELNADVATMDLLSTLRRSGRPYQLTTRELADAALVTAGAISQRLARAEKAGLVRRRPRVDSRVVDVELTAAGHQLVDDLVARVLINEETLLAGMEPGQRQQLADLLQQLLSHLQAHLGPAEISHVGDIPPTTNSSHTGPPGTRQTDQTRPTI
ncbi:MarR family winged helix-turn-helix transcriptional regulator [Williamsia sp. MIQD14]|uniref:MarR family winged helix-turn-helix transcriptional regulator n=1 Tax=Williamsia sp. MIQD14 TaxID=3425703 RepID=UPI003DA1AC03